MSKLGRHDPDDDDPAHGLAAGLRGPGPDLKPRAVAFLQPRDISPGASARIAVVPLTLSALRQKAVFLYHLPQHYHLVLSYEILSNSKFLVDSMLIEESDMEAFYYLLDAGRLPDPIVIYVHFGQFNPRTGEIVYRKGFGKDKLDARMLGSHVKGDHPGAQRYRGLGRFLKIETEATVDPGIEGDADNHDGGRDNEPHQGNVHDDHDEDDNHDELHNDEREGEGPATQAYYNRDGTPMSMADGGQRDSTYGADDLSNFGLRKSSRFAKGKKRYLESST